MKYLLSVLFLILCSCGTGCIEDSYLAFYFDEEEFKSEWNAWKSQDIENYSFTLKEEQTVLTYGYEVAIIVKNSIMDSFEYIGKAPYNRDGSIIDPRYYTSISDMYQQIYDMIKNEELNFYLSNNTSSCLISIRYEIEYNREFHYITRFKPIYEIDSGCVGDNTAHEVTVSDFSEN